MRRMDRYQDEADNTTSRIDKNQDLYQNFSNNTIYANLTDVMNANAYDITNDQINNTSSNTREAYQRMQKYQNMETLPPNKKELEDYKYLYERKENKVYDINSVLEEAHKNRLEKDDKEDKRRLKNNDYNILARVNKKKLEQYREEKKKRQATPEEEEIRELIDTIASKTLAGEIDKATSVDLLSDLMATSMMDKIEGSAELSVVDEKSPSKEETESVEKPEIIEVKEPVKEAVEEKTDSKMETDFYSKSMDLSNNDLDLSDDFQEKSLPLVVKILIFITIIIVIALTAFFIYQKVH